MAYQIEFTASTWRRRRCRKAFLRLLLLASIIAAAWGVYDVYVTYNQPTLNMKLAEYESVARPIDEINAAWDKAAGEYNAITRYYRLVWASNPTNFLNAMAVPPKDGQRLGRGFRPVRWVLSTGGECRLDYRYAFAQGDKAEQARALEPALVNSITSILQVVGGKVDVQGVRLENLLNVGELDVSARFSLPDVKSFPVKERVLPDCVKEIALMRKKVQVTKISEGKDAISASTAQAIMMAYLAMGKDKPDFPAHTNVLNVSGWFERADQFIARNNIPGNDSERRQLKQTWNNVGDARFPWDRFRALDNDDLVARTKELMTVSDGAKRFKGFLEKRHSDCRKKLEPFVEAYDRNKIFNEPFVESDLRDRVAKVAGIDSAVVSFREESGVEPPVLEKADEKFTFTWVRWTLAVGRAERGTGNGERETENGETLTLAKIADCVRRALELGPGYALDKVTVNFNDDGNLSDAVVEGLLPVKKVESKKGASGNVN